MCSTEYMSRLTESRAWDKTLEKILHLGGNPRSQDRERRNREMMMEILSIGVPEGSLKGWGALRTIGYF